MMGTPLPPNEPGAHCTVCWDPGQPFADTPTPLYIKMKFVDYSQGDLWDPGIADQLNLEHILTQSVQACVWLVLDSGIFWAVGFSGGVALVTIQRQAPFELAFLSNDPTPCLFEYNDSPALPANRITLGGKAIISYDVDPIL